MLLGVWTARSRTTLALGLAVASAVVSSAACGARTTLRIPRGEDAAGGAGGDDGGDGGAGAGAGPVACPVESFAGDMSGGLGIEIDATHAYWTTVEGRLQRGSLADGTVTTLLELPSSQSAIALDATDVIVADTTQIRRVPKEGGPFESLAPGAFSPFDVVVDGGAVYLLSSGAGVFFGEVWAFAPATGLGLLASGLDRPRAIATDASHVYVVAEGAMVESAFVAASVFRIPKAGGALEVVVPSLSLPFGIEISGDRVVWGTSVDETFSSDARMWQGPVTGPAAVAVAFLGTDLPIAFTLSEGRALVTIIGFEVGSVARSRLLDVPLDGSAVVELLDVAPDFATLVAASPTHLAVTVQRMPRTDPTGFVNVRVLCR